MDAVVAVVVEARVNLVEAAGVVETVFQEDVVEARTEEQEEGEGLAGVPVVVVAVDKQLTSPTRALSLPLVKDWNDLPGLINVACKEMIDSVKKP
jgi:hypothetical protein